MTEQRPRDYWDLEETEGEVKRQTCCARRLVFAFVAFLVMLTALVLLGGCSVGRPVRVGPVQVQPISVQPVQVEVDIMRSGDGGHLAPLGGWTAPPQAGPVVPQVERVPYPPLGPYPVWQAEAISVGLERCRQNDLYSRVKYDSQGRVRDVTCFPKGTDYELLQDRDGDIHYRKGGSYLPQDPDLEPGPAQVNVRVNPTINLQQPAPDITPLRLEVRRAESNGEEVETAGGEEGNEPEGP